MSDTTYTNAASSGISVDKKRLKALIARSDWPGLIYLGQWAVALSLTGVGVWLTVGTAWIWPAMLVHGIFLAVPAYSVSHETAHGTAFRTRWLNEAGLWITSLIYMEEPLHRRYTHTNHHSFTWHAGKDSQMPFDTPMGFGGWLMEVSSLALWRFHIGVMLRLVTRRYSKMMRDVAPENKLSEMTRNARVFLLIYAGLAGLVMAGHFWPLWFLVIPRLLGGPVMLLFTLIQHVEMQENSPSILESTRSFKTSWLGRFLYMNMNNHVEHHLYPQVPFYALPGLAAEIKGQLPDPDPGFFRTNWEVLVVVLRRSLGLSTKAASIRQAPHMISEGGKAGRVTERTM